MKVSKSTVYPLGFLLFAITIVTVNGPYSSWLEGNGCIGSTFGADNFESLLFHSTPISPLAPTRNPAIVTTLRFIRETPRIKEFLFTNREHE
jgi:hypothetical protein